MTHARLFAFESDFVDSLRCIPMAVRLKLDRCGIKLSLRQWSRFTAQDRRRLLQTPCASAEEIARYRTALQAMVAARTGEAARDLPPMDAVLAVPADRPPAQVARFARSIGTQTPSIARWRALDELERFVLVKLSRDNHDNVNFLPALREFGLI